MKDNCLMEAFKALKGLEEDVFEITDAGIADANEFINSEEKIEPVEDIIDPLAETEEELNDSYVGKVIVTCVNCPAEIFKDPSEIVLNEDETLANVGEECPFCFSTEGFKVVGQVAPFEKEEETEEETIEDSEEVSVEVEEKPEEETEEVEESIKTKKGVKKIDSMKEDLNKVEIETETEKIKIESEPKESVEEHSEEVVAPVSDEVKSEFKKEEPEYTDIEFDEIEEKDFDELGESYLKNIYENVKSFKTTNGRTNGNKLKLEGVITFKSGKKAKTNFVFEAKTATKTGKLKFIGENKQLSKGKKSFVLTGRANGNKLVCESLTYNYVAKDAKTGKSKRLYGTVKR